MNACVLHAVGDLRYETVATPSPGSGEVLVKVGGCGVCGSDIPRVFTKGTYRFPLIPGHEFAGTVAAVGDGVSRDRLGQHVAVFPLLPCHTCGACCSGEYQLCEDYGYLGSRTDGAFGEYVCAPEWNLVPVPEGVSLEEAALTEPAAVAAHALYRGRLDMEDRVLIYGAGPIGLLAAMWIEAMWIDAMWIDAMEACHVTLCDIDPERRVFAASLGPWDLLDAQEAPEREYDLVIEAAGAPAALAGAIRACRRKGRVVLLGNPTGPMTLPADVYSLAMRKELNFAGSWNSSCGEGRRNDWRLALEFMASGRLDVRPLITHRVGLPELGGALTMLRDRREPAAKVICVNGGS